jgi:predicted nucleic acid-binding protein
MDKIIISDTSCLILLSKIGELKLLFQTYGEIIITPEISQEYGNVLPNWVKIISVKNKGKQIEFEKIVDLGEASALALALELKDCLVIMDDKRGRMLAKKLNIEITGTLGTLIKARQQNIIPMVKPILEKLREVNFRIDPEIEKGVLKLVGE